MARRHATTPSTAWTRRKFLWTLGAGLCSGAVGCREDSQLRPESGVLEPFNVLAGRPTATSVSLSVLSPISSPWVLEWGQDPGRLTHNLGPRRTDPAEPGEITISELLPSTRYYYRLRCTDGGAAERVPPLEGLFHTRRRTGESFVFTLTTDSHLVAGRPRGEASPFTLAVARAKAERPDFHITLGDEAMTHYARHYSDPDLTNAAYMNYRRHYAPMAGVAPLFFILGNHEGEGWKDEGFGHSRSLADHSRRARVRYIPNPIGSTYPQGGSPTGSYFTWTWGDALLIALDPYTYSSTRPQSPDDWTLGDEQLAWLQRVLRTSTKRWKFVFQHQLVGGSSWAQNRYGKWGSYRNYGRGGAAFAHAGEQGSIHKLMKAHGGRIVFKGHDHIFADETADGIRYTTCGRLAGPRRPDGPQWASDPTFRALYPNGFDGRWGYIRVAVSPEHVDVKYISTTGETLGGYALDRSTTA